MIVNAIISETYRINRERNMSNIHYYKDDNVIINTRFLGRNKITINGVDNIIYGSESFNNQDTFYSDSGDKIVTATRMNHEGIITITMNKTKNITEVVRQGSNGIDSLVVNNCSDFVNAMNEFNRIY